MFATGGDVMSSPNANLGASCTIKSGKSISAVNGLYVLLVEAEAATRSLIKVELEVEGVEVVSAESLAQARAVIDEPFEAALIDVQLPDGPGESLVDELLERLPPSRVIIHGRERAMADLPAVAKCDIDAIRELLGLRRLEGLTPAVRTARQSLGRIHREWADLCHWDPELPPGAIPPIAETVITAVSNALERPQPLGWGLDPALEPVANAFGLNVGSVTTALGQLVCLREAFARVVISQLEESQVETLRRLQMVIDRAMLVVADTGMRRLADQALTDPLTSLGNRRAFEQDLRRELTGISRSHDSLTVAVLDVDGLKHVNDTLGHPAGDQLLRRVARAVNAATRASDRGYRIGGDEFALILVDAAGIEADQLLKRLYSEGAPKITIGVASVPSDDPERLVELADARLYAQRQSLKT